MMPERLVSNSWPAPFKDPDKKGESYPQDLKPLFYELTFAQELAAFMTSNLWKNIEIPPGDGSSIIFVPNLYRSNVSMYPIREFFNRAGYQVHAPKIGLFNNDFLGNIEKIADTIERVSIKDGYKVKVVGLDWGGYQAKRAVTKVPEYADSFINIGGRVTGDPTLSLDHILVRSIEMVPNGQYILDRLREECNEPIPDSVRVASIRTNDDPLVEKRFIEYPGGTNIVIKRGSRMGLSINPYTWQAVGDEVAKYPPTKLRGAKITPFPVSRVVSKSAA